MFKLGDYVTNAANATNGPERTNKRTGAYLGARNATMGCGRQRA